jgi:hypothetical protein
LRSSSWIAIAVVVAAAPSRAHAFADAVQFFDQKAVTHAATFGASSEGLYFTGAPRFASLDCSSCHGGGPQRVGLRLNSATAELFSTGYQPKKTYELQVVLTNESEGLQFNKSPCTDPPAPGDTFTYVQCNNNGFALEVDDVTDTPLVGSFCAAPLLGTMCPMPDYTADQTLVAPDGDAIFGEKVYSTDPNMPKAVPKNGANSWTFYWTAPPAGTGPLTVYVAAVDGNGGAGSAANDQDPYGDDTVSASFFLREADVPVHNNASAACSLCAHSANPTPLAFFVLLLAFRRRRRALFLRP